MPRYQPTPEEASAIRLLEGSGYAVVRRKTYLNLQKKNDEANWQIYQAHQMAESARHYGEVNHKEYQRMRDRLMAVIAAGAKLGTDIQDINKVLGLDP